MTPKRAPGDKIEGAGGGGGGRWAMLGAGGGGGEMSYAHLVIMLHHASVSTE